MAGIIVGAVPGFNAQNALIILLPVSLTMDVDKALVFMVSLYCATHLGGGIPAILMNIPGTGGAAATTLFLIGLAFFIPGSRHSCSASWPRFSAD